MWCPPPFHRGAREGTMRYLCLIYDDETRLAARSKKEADAFERRGLDSGASDAYTSS
jgi:hypothetical protein